MKFTCDCYDIDIKVSYHGCKGDKYATMGFMNRICVLLNEAAELAEKQNAWAVAKNYNAMEDELYQQLKAKGAYDNLKEG